VIITGASQGVGRALAHRCHRDGARVILLARSIDTLHELCEGGLPTSIAHWSELRAANPRNEHLPTARYIDMAEPNGFDDLFATLPDGRFDVLVNNAGVAGASSVVSGYACP